MVNINGLVTLLIFLPCAYFAIEFLSKRSSFFKGEYEALRKRASASENNIAGTLFLSFEVLILHGPGLIYIFGLILSPFLFKFEDKEFKALILDFVIVWASFFIQIILTPLVMKFTSKYTKTFKLLGDDFDKARKEKGIIKSFPELVYGIIGLFWFNFGLVLILFILTAYLFPEITVWTSKLF